MKNILIKKNSLTNNKICDKENFKFIRKEFKMVSVYSDWDKFISVACSMIGKDRDFSRLRYFTNRSLRWPSCQTKWTTIRDKELKALSVEISKQYFSINR